MAASSNRQLTFGFQTKLRVRFDGGTITSDGGLALVPEFDDQRDLSAGLIGCIRDERDARYVLHDIGSPVRRRLYPIIAGYEDANDADRLREDPTFGLPIRRYSTKVHSPGTWVGFFGRRPRTKLVAMKLISLAVVVGVVALASVNRKRDRLRAPVDGPWFV